jgi:hypothetical protein
MKERNVTITLDQARAWFSSGNEQLREIALQAFSKDELMWDFRNIVTMWGACDALRLHYPDIVSIVTSIEDVSKASAAAFKLDIVRRALNLGQDLQLARNPRNSYIYYPYNPLATLAEGCLYYKKELDSGILEVIGKIKSKGISYNVLNGFTRHSIVDGVSNFHYHTGVCEADANFGFLGCANEEIAKHFGKYFGMLITEAKYGNMPSFEIVESKYTI